MEIAKVKVMGTRAQTVTALDIPEGIVGATVSFEFGPDWAGLTKNVVFVGAKDVEILNIQDSVYLPPEVVSAPNIIVKVGIVGVDANKKIVIPTLWADLGTVKPGAPIGMGYDPTLPIWAQLLGMIGDLRNLNTQDKSNLVAAVNEAINNSGGGTGGYYTPVVTQPTANTMEISFVPSMATMPAVEPVTITLPGSDSGQNVELDTTLTQSGKAADAKAVGDALVELEKKIPEQPASAELFDKADLPLDNQSFITEDGVEYYRYNANATNFVWENPRPEKGAVTITARGVSQYSGSGSTRLKTVYDDGTNGPDLFIVVSGESKTTTVTTDENKTLSKITGNYDMENWVLLDMSVMSVKAEYLAQEEYKIPVATAGNLGGVKADPAESTDTQPVRIGEDGKLYTAPGVASGGVTPLPSSDEWDVHYKANIAEALENGFEITEVDGKPLQLKELWALVKLQSAVDSAWLGCEITTDNPSVVTCSAAAEVGGVNANTNDYAYFTYHAIILPESNRFIVDVSCARGRNEKLIRITNDNWLHNWLEYNPVNYFTGIKCNNNLGAGTSHGYGTEIELWGKTK